MDNLNDKNIELETEIEKLTTELEGQD